MPARKPADTAGGIGVEEFCVLLRGTDLEGVRVFADRLRRQLETEPAMLGDLRLTVTVSGGASTFLTNDTIPAAAMQRADAALYLAKAAGRNRVELAETPSRSLGLASLSKAVGPEGNG